MAEYMEETEGQGRVPRMLAFRTAVVGETGHFHGFYTLLVIVMRKHGMWERTGHASVNQD
jgi:hypothetical protein